MRSKSIKQVLDQNIHFRVTKEQLEFLEHISKTYNCTIPQMLRIIIDHEMGKIIN